MDLITATDAKWSLNPESVTFLYKYRVVADRKAFYLFVEALRKELPYEEYTDVIEVCEVGQENKFTLKYLSRRSVSREVIYSEDHPGYKLEAYAESPLEGDSEGGGFCYPLKTRTGWRFKGPSFVINLAHITIDQPMGGDSASAYEFKFEMVSSRPPTLLTLATFESEFLKYYKSFLRSEVVYTPEELQEVQRFCKEFRVFFMPESVLMTSDLRPDGIIPKERGSQHTYTVSVEPGHSPRAFLIFFHGVWLYTTAGFSKLSSELWDPLHQTAVRGHSIPLEERSGPLAPQTKYYFLASDLLVMRGALAGGRHPQRMRELETLKESLEDLGSLTFRLKSLTEVPTFDDFFEVMRRAFVTIEINAYTFRHPMIVFEPVYSDKRRVVWFPEASKVLQGILRWKPSLEGRVPYFDNQQVEGHPELEGVPQSTVVELVNGVYVPRYDLDNARNYPSLVTKEILQGETDSFYVNNMINSMKYDLMQGKWLAEAEGVQLPSSTLDLLKEYGVKVDTIGERRVKRLVSFNISFVPQSERLLVDRLVLAEVYDAPVANKPYKPRILGVLEVERLPTWWHRNLYRIGTKGDGTCMIHSILTALSEEYREAIRRKDFSLGTRFRRSTPYLLEEPIGEIHPTPISMHSTSGELISTSGSGTLRVWQWLELIFPNFFNSSQELLPDGLEAAVNDTDIFNSVDTSLPRIQSVMLDTHLFIGESELPLLEVLLGVRVIFLYQSNNLVIPAPFKRHAHIDPLPHIVLFNITGTHWEVVGEMAGPDKYKTVFFPSDPIVRLAYAANNNSNLLRENSQEISKVLTPEEIKVIIES